MEPLSVVVVVVVACHTAGLALLGGAAGGLCVLLPSLARAPDQRRPVVAWARAAARVETGWLAGWCAAAGGTWLRGLWPVVLALLVGSALRGAGLGWRAGALTAAGGAVTVLAWGWAVASLLHGDPLRPMYDAGAALTACAVALLLVSHGVGLAAVRLAGPVGRRARLLTGGTGRQSYALGACAVAALPLLVGARLPAPDVPAVAVLPAAAAVPLLVVATWRIMRAPVREESGRRPYSP